MIVEPSVGAQALRCDHQATAPALPLPAVGSTLQLSVLAREQLGVRVVTEQGLTLLLPGLVAAELQPGAQLLMRVVATRPRLQLMTLPPQQPAGSAGAAAQRQLPVAAEQARVQGWQLQKPAADTLAAGWRGLLLAAAAKPQPDGDTALPAMLLAGMRAEHDPLAQARRLAEQGWNLAHCWPGQTLRLALADEEPAEGSSGDELLLQLQLPYWGALLLRLRSSSAGPVLQLHSESATVLVQWQACLPRWRQAMLAAGYHLLLQLQHGRLDVAVARPGLARRASVPALAQFQLAAHMILLLQAAAEEALAADAPPAPAESTTT